MEGSLVIHKDNTYVKYYVNQYNKSNNGMKRSYLDRNKVDFIKSLAQKSYINKLNILINKRLSQIKAINRDYDNFEIENIYNNLSFERKELVESIIPTREQNLQK